LVGHGGLRRRTAGRREMHLRDIDDTQDMTDGAGLNQQAQIVGAVRAHGPCAKDIRRRGTAVVVAGILGRAGIFDLESRFDVLQQARLHFQDGLGIVVKIGIGMGPSRQGRR